MKLLKYSLFLFFVLIQTSYAAKLSDYVNVGKSVASASSSGNTTSASVDKILENALSSVQEEIMGKLDGELTKVQEKLESNVDKAIGKFDSEIQGTIDKVNNDIIGKAEKLVNDATKEYETLVESKNAIFTLIQAVIENLPQYILYAKIVCVIVAVGMILLVLLFWRTYRNTKKILKLLEQNQPKTKSKK